MATLNIRANYTRWELERDIRVSLADAITYRRAGRRGLRAACVKAAWGDRAELRRRAAGGR